MIVNQIEPDNMQSVFDLWVSLGRPEKMLEKMVRHALRVVSRSLGFSELEQCPIQGFPRSREELKQVLRADGLKEDAGLRSLISAGMKIVTFGLERGLVSALHCSGQVLGFPDYSIEGRKGSVWRRTLWVWGRLIAFAVGRNVHVSDLDRTFFLEFYDVIMSERGYDLGRRDLRWFIRTVRADVGAGLLPQIELPALPSKKAQAYSFPIEDWPASFQPGIAAIRDWLSGEIVEGRSRKKVREVSARRDLKHLELLGGFAFKIRGREPMAHSWASLLDSDLVMEFLLWTDPAAEECSKDGIILSGTYQDGLLSTYLRLCEGPLRLPETACALKNLRFRFAFESKRTGPPSDLSPDIFFRCAIQLIAKAEFSAVRGQTIGAATYRRDALLVALLGLFPRRTDTAHRITVDKHLILPAAGLPKIAVPREETKPAIRDSILEIPQELVPLFHRYLYEDRLILLGVRASDHKAFFVSQGGAPFSLGNARSILRRRMLEEMGLNIGPHSARHSWTPRFLLWSQGDYLSAMAVLDTSLNHIETAYRDAQESERAASYFEKTERRWNQVKNERGSTDANTISN